MSTQDKDMLQEYVDNIASRLNEGWTYETDEYGEYRTEDGEATDPFGYVCEALDINYRVDSELRYICAEILVTYGGPNVWVHTGGRVEGYWGGKQANAYFSNPELDDAARELFESR